METMKKLFKSKIQFIKKKENPYKKDNLKVKKRAQTHLNLIIKNLQAYNQ